MVDNFLDKFLIDFNDKKNIEISPELETLFNKLVEDFTNSLLNLLINNLTSDPEQSKENVKKG